MQHGTFISKPCKQVQMRLTLLMQEVPLLYSHEKNKKNSTFKARQKPCFEEPAVYVHLSIQLLSGNSRRERKTKLKLQPVKVIYAPFDGDRKNSFLHVIQVAESRRETSYLDCWVTFSLRFGFLGELTLLCSRYNVCCFAGKHKRTN